MKIKCLNCGTENAPNARYCTFCSAPIEKDTKTASPDQSEWSPKNKSQASAESTQASGSAVRPTGLAVIALVCGGLAVLNICPPFSGVAAVVLAGQVKRNIRSGKEPERSRKLAQIGMIAGYIGLGLTLMRWIYFMNSGISIFDIINYQVFHF